MSRLRHFFREKEGAAVAIVAISLTMIVSAMAVAIDLGHYFVVRNELQRAADAGAMAGARRLFSINYGQNRPPSVPDCSGGENQASQIARANPVDGGNLTADSVSAYAGIWNQTLNTFSPDCSSGTNAVKVVTNSSVNTFFARIFGVNSTDIHAQAIAWMSWTGGNPKGTLPIAINKDYALSGAYLFITFNNDIEDTGCWFTKPPDPASAANFKDYINNGSCPRLNVGDKINLQNGVDTSALHALQAQLANQITAHPDAPYWDVSLPLVDTCKFNQQEEIWGFIDLRITGVDDKGKDKGVKGIAMGLAEAPGTYPGGPNKSGQLAAVHLVN